MVKKNFKTGFDILLSDETGNEKKSVINKNPTKETRATFIVQDLYLEKLRALSYWERKKIKDILNNILKNYIESYEKEHGEILLPNLE